MEGRRAGPKDDAGGEGQDRSCCGRRRTPGAPTSSRGRSVRRPRRLFSAERGAGGRSSRRSPDLGLSSCGRDGRGFRLICKWLNRKVVIKPVHAPCAHAWDLSRDWARPWEGLMGEPVRQEARTCSFALGRTAWPARCADVSHARASRRARPSRSRRPAFGAGGEEALACGGRGGGPPGQRHSLSFSARMGFECARVPSRHVWHCYILVWITYPVTGTVCEIWTVGATPHLN